MKTAISWGCWGSWVLLAALACNGCEERSASPPESAQVVGRPSPETRVGQSRSPTASVSTGDGHTTAPEAATTQTLTPAARMAFHSREAEALRQAVISGDFAQARAEAAGLSENNWTPHLKPLWKEHMAAMYEAARDYEHASHLAEASTAVGKLGVACASCHRVLGGPRVEAAVAPASDTAMRRHAWGVERLWLGLVAPSDVAWQQGAKELSHEPLVRSDVKAVDAEAHRLQALGRRAFTASGDERALVLGDVLSTCAACHRAVGYAP